MTAAEIVEEILVSKGITKTVLANELGITKQNLSNKFSRDNFTIQDLEKIAKILQSEIVFKSDNKDYKICY
ncbi:MAG: helix-turn-helix transcriptional regulator [Clostridia bacterium]|nr:helix-turn-helix transcriptional regulator [Clostridia bacterium]